ncbi:single-strand DNA-binding protein [Propionibacterium cyclohexanicum]|uniref:Single-stranded DNA-binding protein n=2 Tax=Propionibacterium cyclohexanicum TaxID=64702 RepID=A0A1H9TNI7_9ACTN|nr:single-strand DNA-binding protein [Propionibacterium cyclohexanicum]
MDTNVSLSGYVGTAVEYTAAEGYSFATFRLATTPRIRRNGEWVDGETTWITVEASNRAADNAAASIHKGDPVIVVGRLQTKRWQGRDGEPRERLVLTALALGHDLARGTSQFTRTPRQSADRAASAAQEQPMTEPADADSSEGVHVA